MPLTSEALPACKCRMDPNKEANIFKLHVLCSSPMKSGAGWCCLHPGQQQSRCPVAGAQAPGAWANGAAGASRTPELERDTPMRLSQPHAHKRLRCRPLRGHSSGRPWSAHTDRPYRPFSALALEPDHGTGLCTMTEMQPCQHRGGPTSH